MAETSVTTCAPSASGAEHGSAARHLGCRSRPSRSCRPSSCRSRSTCATRRSRRSNCTAYQAERLPPTGPHVAQDAVSRPELQPARQDGPLRPNERRVRITRSASRPTQFAADPLPLPTINPTPAPDGCRLMTRRLVDAASYSVEVCSSGDVASRPPGAVLSSPPRHARSAELVLEAGSLIMTGRWADSLRHASSPWPSPPRSVCARSPAWSPWPAHLPFPRRRDIQQLGYGIHVNSAGPSLEILGRRAFASAPCGSSPAHR